MHNHEALLAGAQHILTKSANFAPRENGLLIYDSTTEDLLPYFIEAAESISVEIQFEKVPISSNHGEEPPLRVSDSMLNFDVTLALTKFSFAHSKARVRASSAGNRFLSLPEFSGYLLSHPMILADYAGLSRRAEWLANKLTLASEARLITAMGTDIYFDLRERSGNSCPGFVKAPGDLGSPPNVESNISPLENKSRGIAFVDGSITHPKIGLLRAPVKMFFQDGLAVQFDSPDEKVQTVLDDLFQSKEPLRRVLAELGFGLNPLAILSGVMLSDEGALGTAHLGLGSNFTVGGVNEVDFHLDFVLRSPTLFLDGEIVIEEGDFIETRK